MKMLLRAFTVFRARHSMHTFVLFGVMVVLVLADIMYLQATVPTNLARPVWAAGGTSLSAPWHSYLPLAIRSGSARSDGRPSWSAPLAVGPHDGRIWITNPDAGSISVVEPKNLSTVAEISVG